MASGNRATTAISRPNGGPGAAQGKICQFKLVLLGESAVGKSSLVLRFVKGQFHEYQESTIGGKYWHDVVSFTQTICIYICTIAHLTPPPFLFVSCIPHSNTLPRGYNREIRDMGYSWTRTISFSSSNVLSWCSGCNCCLRHHQPGKQICSVPCETVCDITFLSPSIAVGDIREGEKLG